MKLGAFELEDECGRGAMGVVYRAHHARWGTPVAVKILPNAANEPQLLEVFSAEIRALARLDHPHIARVFDHGVVGPSPEGFLEGSPWFAMEYCSGRLVDDARTMSSWHDLHAVLRGLLDALANAHAHGVVHRDLKFSNLLVARPGDLRPGLKLVDFGVALLDSRGTSVNSAGTPMYMPPEQWTHGVAASGPWTDLYAVGVLAWKMVTARTPFGSAQDGDALYAAQRLGDPGEFLPRFEVPRGLEPWLASCIAPEPGSRFQSTADALYALEQLDAAGGWVAGGNTAHFTEDDTNTAPLGRHLESHTSLPRSAQPPPAPVPTQWRAHTPPLPPIALTGAGLTLVALREPVFLGRHTERDTLWRTLAEADRGGRPRLALVGPKGVGASSLGRWLVRAADAQSGAIALTVKGTQGDVPGAAVTRLVEQALRIVATEDSERTIQGQRALDRHRVSFTAANAAVESALTRGSVSQSQRHGAGLTILDALARRRLLVVFFDDVHRDPDLAVFVQLVAERLPKRTLLLARGSGKAASGWTTLEVDPLPDRVLHEALRYLVPLEPQTSRLIVDHAHGHPARAVRMVQRLARIDRLDLGRHGFRLRGRLRLRPTDTAPILEDLSDADRSRLFRAAILGPTVNRTVWGAACATIDGGTPTAELERQWIRDGMAESYGEGWVFPQSSLVGSLRELLRDDPAAPDHHAACARALAGHDPVKEGRCWIAAGDIERGVRVWMANKDRVAEERGNTAQLALVREALEQVEVLPEREDLHGELWNLELTGMRVMAQWNAAEEAAHARMLEATSNGWRIAAAQAAWNLGSSLFERPGEAIVALQRGLEILGDLRAPYVRGLLHFRLCNSALMLGQLGVASDEAARALRSFQDAGSPEALQYASRTGFLIARAKQDSAAALFHARRVLELAERHRPSTTAYALIRLGETLALAGALEEADRVLQQAQDLSRVLGGGSNLVDAVANRMVLAARRGRWTEVRTFGEATLQLDAGTHLRHCCSLFLAVSFAHASRLTTANELLGPVWTWLEGPHRLESDVVFALEALTAVAQERGWASLAKPAGHFARQEREKITK